MSTLLRSEMPWRRPIEIELGRSRLSWRRRNPRPSRVRLRAHMTEQPRDPATEVHRIADPEGETRVASYLANRDEVSRVLLLYSGGLDTSVMLKWIQDEYEAEVVALTVNLGQPGEDYDVVRDKAINLGALDCHVVDAREEFAEEYLKPAIKANADTSESYKEQKIRSYDEGFRLEDDSILALEPEFDLVATNHIQPIFPQLVIQQIHNTLVCRQLLPKGPSNFELIFHISYLPKVQYFYPPPLLSMKPSDSVQVLSITKALPLQIHPDEDLAAHPHKKTLINLVSYPCFDIIWDNGLTD